MNNKIDNKIEEIQNRVSERIIAFAKKYEGTSMYNDIMLAIQEGYQIRLEEEEALEEIHTISQ